MEAYNENDDTLDVNNVNPDKLPEKENSENEIPEKGQSEHEKSEYPRETEYSEPENGNDASYSEQTDVTPPRNPEFPSVGNTETDFTPGTHGRSTGRMVGHEPGTEGI